MKKLLSRRGAPPAAAIPFKRTDEHAVGKHAAFLERIEEGPIELLFLGDSITRRWEDNPGIWDSAFGEFSPANFGVGADRCQDLLWRIENGELESISPKLVVLLVGTNNAPGDRGRDIAAGIARIVETLRKKAPEARILLLAIIPRGPHRGEEGYGPEAKRVSRAIAEANAILRGMADGDRIVFADLSRHFLDDRGRLRRELLPDGLHPGEEGYRVLARFLRPLIAALMAGSCPAGEPGRD
ncbi:MAG: GDSL-type esterase/lipase family protein [Spirochaetaceae bacterium]|nr:GDSL-type esterase/lipase family protein [Spirochaetaceae bacterium]